MICRCGTQQCTLLCYQVQSELLEEPPKPLHHRRESITNCNIVKCKYTHTHTHTYIGVAEQMQCLYIGIGFR